MKANCINLFKSPFKFYFYNVKHFSFSKVQYYAEKYTLQLLPEVENEIESGKMKHRKHPGIRKRPPMVLPERLERAVQNIIPEEQVKIFKSAAKELTAVLAARRLPIESEEIQLRLLKLYPHLQDGMFEFFPDTIKKEQLKGMKRQLSSELYRWKPIEYDYQQSLAYLVARLAANYASISRVFYEIKLKLEEFQPKTYFDFGSGVGSGIWAAYSEFGGSLKEYFCVDTSSDMNDIAQELLTDEDTKEVLLKSLFFRQFLPASENIKYDLVLSAFSLLELPSAKDRLQVIDTLWRKTNDMLVIIEFGNKAGFLSVLDARDYILQIENPNSEFSCYSTGAHILAPCPHDSTCPKFEDEDKTCGVFVPYRGIFTDRWEAMDKKDWISYVVLRKGFRPEGDVRWPRIVKPILGRKNHVHCRICCSDGKLHETIITRAKNGRHTYRCVRSSSIGDVLPVNMLQL